MTLFCFGYLYEIPIKFIWILPINIIGHQQIALHQNLTSYPINSIPHAATYSIGMYITINFEWNVQSQNIGNLNANFEGEKVSYPNGEYYTWWLIGIKHSVYIGKLPLIGKIPILYL